MRRRLAMIVFALFLATVTCIRYDVISIREDSVGEETEFKDNEAMTQFSLYIENDEETKDPSSDGGSGNTTSDGSETNAKDPSSTHDSGSSIYNGLTSFFKTGDNLLLSILILFSFLSSIYLIFAFKSYSSSK